MYICMYVCINIHHKYAHVYMYVFSYILYVDSNDYRTMEANNVVFDGRYQASVSLGC